MTQIETFFWSCVFVALGYEIVHTTMPRMMRNRRMRFAQAINDLQYTEDEEEVPGGRLVDQMGILIGFASMVALGVQLVGMMSSQALFFFLYFFVSLLITILYKKFFYALWVFVLDGFLCTCILVAAILNKFVFHITVYQVYLLWKNS